MTSLTKAMVLRLFVFITGVGASSFSCSEIYSGSTPFSENESQAMARLVTYLLWAINHTHNERTLQNTPLLVPDKICLVTSQFTKLFYCERAHISNPKLL